MLKNRNLFILLAVVLLGLWLWASSNEKAGAEYDRPNDPWVFRSVLDKQARMITLALDEDLWVAYSTDSCSLYKAWAGSVAFEGAVYNMRHGPQPTSVGSAWFENKFKQPWQVRLNGKTELPKTDYKGHRYTSDGHAEIMFDLVLSDGQRIRINERPEFVEVDRQKGLERVFEVVEAPAGAEISLLTNAGSIAGSNGVKTDGELVDIETRDYESGVKLSTIELDGRLVLNPDGETHLTCMFVRQPLYKNPNAASLEEEEGPTLSPGEKLMAKTDCRTCHNPQVKTVGPSYKEISERYKNTTNNWETLAQKVIQGGSGNWGIAAMSAHPDLQPEDAISMVQYILSLDEGEDDGEGGNTTVDLASIPADQWLKPDASIKAEDVEPGLPLKVFQLAKNPETLDRINFNAKPDAQYILGQFNIDNALFGELKENFALEATGYIFLEKDDNVLLQLSSDDGSRLYLDDALIIDNDGLHGMAPIETELALRGGYHKIKLQYFQGAGGRGISLEWARSGQSGMEVIPDTKFYHRPNEGESKKRFGQEIAKIPGDQTALTEVHPSYDLSQARPNEFLPKVAGMDFMSDGRLVVSTWDAMGGVYILENVDSGDPDKIKYKRIAKGLAEPLGLKVVNDTIYVLQKQELTRLIDTDGDEIIDEYQCFAKGWRASANFHEFAFGLAYKDNHFYATLAIGIMPGGASARPQIPDRGKVIRISKADGSIEFIARGLRTPNGIGLGVDDEIFVADNQGDWLPSSKILHVSKGAFFNSYAVDSANVASLPVKPPVVWLPQDEIGNSPSTPLALNDGPFKGQMIHGEVTHGGVKRVYVEKVNGEYQGCVFRFIQGLEAGVNRMVWGPDGALYIGGIGNPGNWQQNGKLWYGLQRLKYNENPSFEMLAVRAKTNGIEIEFTEPLREGDGWSTSHYDIQQWRYVPTIEYGGPKVDPEVLPVRSASVSKDRKSVFLEIDGIKAGHLVYVHLKDLPISDNGHSIWSTEAWYTMNQIPQDKPGEVLPTPDFPPKQDNALSAKEVKEGWKLLFDGSSLNGWHNYGKKGVGKSWIIQDNALYLDAKPSTTGHWQAEDGGDILTDGEYQDFEFTLEWKISACGNSGIYYNVIENPEKYGYGWMTGPEMQVLDDACHPDSRFPMHRAGDLYDMQSCKYITVKPAGEWNHVRIISKNGKIEQWQNYRKVVSYDINDPSWPEMIAKSKFREWEDFGTAKKGKIALQDHGNPVWFKNIKIRKL
ncbi:MAG: family 16 glycoside hydrolase [Saprospiraceae bacterium]